jgi:hypothetical protein
MSVPPVPVAKYGDITPMPDLAVRCSVDDTSNVSCCMVKTAHRATLKGGRICLLFSCRLTTVRRADETSLLDLIENVQKKVV